MNVYNNTVQISLILIINNWKRAGGMYVTCQRSCVSCVNKGYVCLVLYLPLVLLLVAA